MGESVQKLLDRKFAYIVDKDVYFDTAKYPNLC